MKLAHLILTHSNPGQLQQFAQKLVRKDADFYLHVDKKTPIEPFLTALAGIPNVKFVQNRFMAYWGGIVLI